MRTKGMKELLLVSLAVCLVAGTGFSQAPMRDILTADIPFAFMVENTTLPAGQYELTQTVAQPYTWYISNAKGDVKIVFYTEPAEMVNRPGTFQLVFDAYGDQYFLSRIWLEDNTDGFYVAKTGMEREMMNKGKKPQMKNVPLSKKRM